MHINGIFSNGGKLNLSKQKISKSSNKLVYQIVYQFAPIFKKERNAGLSGVCHSTKILVLDRTGRFYSFNYV